MNLIRQESLNHLFICTQLEVHEFCKYIIYCSIFSEDSSWVSNGFSTGLLLLLFGPFLTRGFGPLGSLGSGMSFAKSKYQSRGRPALSRASKLNGGFSFAGNNCFTIAENVSFGSWGS
jgi:hypothetical protein